MSNEYYEIQGVYCKYTDDGFDQMCDFIQKAASFSIDNSERDMADYIFLIKRISDFHLCTGYTPTSVDVKVNNIEHLKAFYERENSKLGKLL